MGLVGGLVIREADGKVQEKCRLQRLRHHEAPVEYAQLAGRPEAVEHKRSQTKDIEVDRFRCSPSPEQHINPDAEVDESDKPQILIKRPVLGLENDLDIKPRGAVQIDRLRKRSSDRIVGMR